jgi:hypothetical protein
MVRSIAAPAQPQPQPTVVPLPAGVWGVRCVPGPDWSDFPLTRTVGTVLNPEAVLAEWCDGAAGKHHVGGTCRHSAAHQLGGWFIGRSAAVLWDGDDEVYFHKCGDGGEYDLAWAPPDDFVFNVNGYARVEAAFHRYCQSVAPRSASHIIQCETRLRCRGLARMLAGEDARDVVRTL